MAVVKMAEPLMSALVAKGVAPSLKVTVPLGVPAPPLTVAVKVTDWPKTDGFCEEATLVVVEAAFTVTLLLVPVARTAAASVAVIVWVPAVLKTKDDRE